MVRLPRFALGTVQNDVDYQPVLWALLAVMHQHRIDGQVFLPQSRFVPYDGSFAINGRRQRHLDSWLMSPETCQSAFLSGSEKADVSLVVGHYTSTDTKTTAAGGTLDALCHWLDLPQLVIVDVSKLGPCRMANFPNEVAGVFLDNVRSRDELIHWATVIESHVGAPVLGSLRQLPDARLAIKNLGQLRQPNPCICETLRKDISPSLRLSRLMAIARQTEFTPSDISMPLGAGNCRRLNVAMAYDDAFFCYFPDTLDALESGGARLTDFSPLKHDQLPPDTDLVMLGCGHPEQFAEQLSANCCMKQSLQDHVRRRGRIYAEAGGLAYICREMIHDHRRYSMAALLPAIANHNNHGGTRPIEFRLARDSWIGGESCQIRGYLNSRWSITPTDPIISLVADPEHLLELVQLRGIVGSRLHLHFTSQPEILGRILRSAIGSHH